MFFLEKCSTSVTSNSLQKITVMSLTLAIIRARKLTVEYMLISEICEHGTEMTQAVDNVQCCFRHFNDVFSAFRKWLGVTIIKTNINWRIGRKNDFIPICQISTAAVIMTYNR